MHPDLIPVRRVVNTHRPTASLVLPEVKPGIGENGDLSPIFVFGDEDVLRAIGRCAVKVAAVVSVPFASPDVGVGLADFVVCHAFHLLALVRVDEDAVPAEDPEVVVGGRVILFSVEVEVVGAFQAPGQGIENVLHLDSFQFRALGYVDCRGSREEQAQKVDNTKHVGVSTTPEPNHDWSSLPAKSSFMGRSQVSDDLEGICS